MAFDFPDDGGYGVGGEVVAVFGVEAVDGFDEADGGDLDQVVEGFAAAVEALRQMLGQRQPGLDGLPAQGRPVGVRLGQEVDLLHALAEPVADDVA